MTKKNRSARRIILSAIVFMLSLANFLPTFHEKGIRRKTQESNLKEIDL